MNSGYKQYLRAYRLLVIPKSGGDTLDVSQLRITFSVEKATKDTPNFSRISIYNLAMSTIAGIKPGDTVVLEAGYRDNMGMIFTGEIVQPYVSREGSVDIALVLLSQDGDQFLTSSFTAQTLSKGSTLADAVGACSAGMNTNILTDKLNEHQYIRGKVLFGKSADILSDTAKSVQSQFFVCDGKINIAAAKDYDGNTAVELNPSTGLIETPNQTDDGVSAKCLLNPSLKLNSLIHINANLVAAQEAKDKGKVTDVNADGIYRIVKMVYEGDTRGGPWYCTFDAVTQTGLKPDGLVQGEENPWR